MTLFNQFSAVLSLGLVGCGAPGPDAPRNDVAGVSANAEIEEPSAIAVPPLAYYEAALAAEFDLVVGNNVTDDRRYTIYVNLDGGSVANGYAAGESFLACDAVAEIPTAGLNQDTREDIIFYVSNYFKTAYPMFEVTFEKPVATHTTIFVTDAYGDLGCDSFDLPYHSPFDHENFRDDDVGFAFVAGSVDNDALVTSIETAAELTFGIKAQSNLLNYATVEQSSLPGLEEIHAMSRLLWELDDDQILDISPLHPALEKLVPGGLKHLKGFDKIVSVTVGVSANQSEDRDDGGGSGGLFDRLGGLFGGGNNGGSTSNSSPGADVISAVATLAGAPEIAQAAQTLGPLLQDGHSGSSEVGGDDSASSSEKNPQVPGYHSVLGLGDYSSLNELGAHLRGHAQFVAGEYEGETAEAIRSLLVVAYAQAFRQHLNGEAVAADD